MIKNKNSKNKIFWKMDLTNWKYESNEKKLMIILLFCFMLKQELDITNEELILFLQFFENSNIIGQNPYNQYNLDL